MRFEFATAGRIVFGPGVISELPAIAKSFGRRAFVVTGKDKIRHAGRIAELEGGGLTCALFGTPHEPTVDLVREGAALCRAASCELVIAIGGGSAIDAGKAIAALAANSGDVLDYLEVVGKGQPLTHAPLPFIAVSTTAGTGSEVTRNAVLGVPEQRVKVSLRSIEMLPKVALVDPDLTIGLPRSVAAGTGLDALTQLIEAWVSCRANPMTDALCVDGLRAAAGSLPSICAGTAGAEARAGMSWASLLSGMALANAGLGVVHGLAAPIGGMFDAPHGAVCAALLPHAMEVNTEAVRSRAPDSPALGRYEQIASLLPGGMAWVRELVRAIPRLAEYGVKDSDVATLAEKASRASSMKANPIALTHAEIEDVLRAAL